MSSKLLYSFLFVVFACCATATAVGDHSGGQNDNSGATFSQQNCPSYTYEVDRQVSKIIYINIIIYNYKIYILEHSIATISVAE